VLVLAGVVLRVVVLTGPWGTIDSDEAVVGLMARDMRMGEWRAFYWGQHYGGTQETALVALFGASRWALKLVPAGLSAVVALLTWRVGTRFLTPRSAVVAGVLTWLGPGAYVWWSTKERGFYWVSIATGLLVLLSVQRLVERGGRPLDWLLLGAAFGSGWWASPSVAYYAAPAGLYLLARRSPPLRWLPLGAVAAVVASLPWWWHNLEQGWASLDPPSLPSEVQVSYVDGLGRLLWYVLPIAVNLRVPISADWVLPVVAAVAYVGLGVALLVRRPPALLALALVTFPFLYAAFPGRWWVGEGRYAAFVLPFVGLALAWLVRRPWPSVALAVVWLGLSVASLDAIGPDRPEHVEGDLVALREAGVDRAWADYWSAHRLAFLSDGDLVASSYVVPRDEDAERAVRDDPTPAFLLRDGDPKLEPLRAALPDAEVVRTANYVVLLLDRPIDPDVLGRGVVP